MNLILNKLDLQVCVIFIYLFYLKYAENLQEGPPLWKSQRASVWWLSFAEKMADQAPSVAMEAVLKPSCDLPEDMPKIRGYDFNQGVDLHAVLKSYLTTGFQASSLALAIQEINTMVRGQPLGGLLTFSKRLQGVWTHMFSCLIVVLVLLAQVMLCASFGISSSTAVQEESYWWES